MVLSFQVLRLKKRIIKHKYVCKVYERKTLQVRPPYINCICENKSLKKERRASFFASFTTKEAKAFFTLEASIVLPVIICVICAFLWIFSTFKVQMELQEALRSVSQELSEYAYLYEKVRNLPNDEQEYVKVEESGIERWLLGGITEGYVEGRIKKLLGDGETGNYIVGGEEGIELESFLRIPDSDGMIDLIVVYKIKNPFLPGNMAVTEYVQRSRIRAWTGYSYYEEGSEDETAEVVYVTEYGSVYHVTRNCTHLDLSIICTPYLGLPMIYNGKNYIECSICMSGVGINVYVTETGDCYHWNISCRSLRRTIYEIPIEQAGKYRPCSRCGKEVGN